MDGVSGRRGGRRIPVALLAATVALLTQLLPSGCEASRFLDAYERRNSRVQQHSDAWNEEGVNSASNIVDVDLPSAFSDQAIDGSQDAAIDYIAALRQFAATGGLTEALRNSIEAELLGAIDDADYDQQLQQDSVDQQPEEYFNVEQLAQDELEQLIYESSRMPQQPLGEVEERVPADGPQGLLSEVELIQDDYENNNVQKLPDLVVVPKNQVPATVENGALSDSDAELDELLRQISDDPGESANLSKIFGENPADVSLSNASAEGGSVGFGDSADNQIPGLSGLLPGISDNLSLSGSGADEYRVPFSDNKVAKDAGDLTDELGFPVAMPDAIASGDSRAAPIGSAAEAAAGLDSRASELAINAHQSNAAAVGGNRVANSDEAPSLWSAGSQDSRLPEVNRQSRVSLGGGWDDSVNSLGASIDSRRLRPGVGGAGGLAALESQPLSRLESLPRIRGGSFSDSSDVSSADAFAAALAVNRGVGVKNLPRSSGFEPAVMVDGALDGETVEQAKSRIALTEAAAGMAGMEGMPMVPLSPKDVTDAGAGLWNSMKDGWNRFTSSVIDAADRQKQIMIPDGDDWLDRWTHE